MEEKALFPEKYILAVVKNGRGNAWDYILREDEDCGECDARFVLKKAGAVFYDYILSDEEPALELACCNYTAEGLSAPCCVIKECIRNGGYYVDAKLPRYPRYDEEWENRRQEEVCRELGWI